MHASEAVRRGNHAVSSIKPRKAESAEALALRLAQAYHGAYLGRGKGPASPASLDSLSIMVKASWVRQAVRLLCSAERKSKAQAKKPRRSGNPLDARP